MNLLEQSIEVGFFIEVMRMINVQYGSSTAPENRR